MQLAVCAGANFPLKLMIYRSPSKQFVISVFRCGKHSSEVVPRHLPLGGRNASPLTSSEASVSKTHGILIPSSIFSVIQHHTRGGP